MGYISLKDLYSGSVLGNAVPPLPRQTIKHTLIEQAPAPAVQPVAFDLNIVTDWTTWASVDVPSDLFEAGKQALVEESIAWPRFSQVSRQKLKLIKQN